MVEVRHDLRRLMLGNNGVKLQNPKVLAARLDRAAAAATFRIRGVASGKARYEPVGEGLDLALAHLFEIVLRSQADGSWKRLKSCLKQDCRTVFFDVSRNRARRWCKRRCGNLSSARASRKRHKTSSWL